MLSQINGSVMLQLPIEEVVYFREALLASIRWYASSNEGKVKGDDENLYTIAQMLEACNNPISDDKK